MATRTFVNTKGETWEWEENPKVVKAIQDYWKVVEENKKTIDL